MAGLPFTSLYTKLTVFTSSFYRSPHKVNSLHSLIPLYLSPHKVYSLRVPLYLNLQNVYSPEIPFTSPPKKFIHSDPTLLLCLFTSDSISTSLHTMFSFQISLYFSPYIVYSFQTLIYFSSHKDNSFQIPSTSLHTKFTHFRSSPLSTKFYSPEICLYFSLGKFTCFGSLSTSLHTKFTHVRTPLDLSPHHLYSLQLLHPKVEEHELVDEEHVETTLKVNAGADETGVDSDQSPLLLRNLLLQGL